MEFLNRACHTAGAALSRDHRAAANADLNPIRLMNVRAAWKASHRLRMLDQSDGSVSTVQRALFRPWMTLQDQQLAEEE
jgi:hypothetical protein